VLNGGIFLELWRLARSTSASQSRRSFSSRQYKSSTRVPLISEGAGFANTHSWTSGEFLSGLALHSSLLPSSISCLTSDGCGEPSFVRVIVEEVRRGVRWGLMDRGEDLGIYIRSPRISSLHYHDYHRASCDRASKEGHEGITQSSVSRGMLTFHIWVQ